MNTRFILALALAAGSVTAHAALEENLLADPWLRQAPTYGAPASANNIWISTIERPAIGSVGRETGHQLADSVMVANVRYLSASDSPTCSYSQTVIGLTPHQYRFSAWVKMEEQGASLTLRASGSDGSSLGSISVATDGSATALTPGRWTPVELALDLTATPDAALSSVTFSIEPMVNADGPVVTQDFHQMLVMHPFAGVVDNRSNIVNGAMELWSPALEAWNASAEPTQAAGLHVHDSAVTLQAGETLTSESLEVSSLKNTLQFAARADQDAKVTVTSDRGATEVALPGGAWRMLEVPANLSQTGSVEFALSANMPWTLDEVSLCPIYDAENPRPAERTLHVTISDNDGEGSLRQVVASSLSGDEILIDVTYIYLTEPIDLSDKTITIKSGLTYSTPVIQCKDAFSAFIVNPTVDGHSLRMENVKITSSKWPQRGAGMIIGANGEKALASIALVSVTFDSCLASLEGGGIYCNAPNVDLYMINCWWESCGSAKGAFLYHGAGTVAMDGCQQGFYLGSDSTNEQIYAASGQGALKINACRFNELANNTRGTSFIHIEGTAPVVEITNSGFYPQWYYTVPAAKAAYITVNNSTRRGGGRITLANNTMYRVYEGALIELANSVTAYPPQVCMVNNIVLTKGDTSITNEKCDLQGSHNILANDIDGLSSTLISTWDKRDVFSFTYAQECDDYPMTLNGETYLNEEGIAYHADTPSYEVDGVNVVPAADFAGRERPNPPSIGMSELAGHSGVEDLEEDITTSKIPAWYDASARVIHIVGDVRQAALVSLSGVTQIVTSANEIDASRFAPGIYLLRIVGENGNITVHKLIIR